MHPLVSASKSMGRLGTTICALRQPACRGNTSSDVHLHNMLICSGNIVGIVREQRFRFESGQNVFTSGLAQSVHARSTAT